MAGGGVTFSSSTSLLVAVARFPPRIRASSFKSAVSRLLLRTCLALEILSSSLKEDKPDEDKLAFEPSDKVDLSGNASMSCISWLNSIVVVPSVAVSSGIVTDFSSGDLAAEDSPDFCDRNGNSFDNEISSLGSESELSNDRRFFSGFLASDDGEWFLFLPLKDPSSVCMGSDDVFAGLSSCLNTLGDGGELKRLRAGEVSAGDFLELLVLRAGESTDKGDFDFFALLVWRAGESTDGDGDFLALLVFLAGESTLREGDLEGFGDFDKPTPSDTSPVSSTADFSASVDMLARMSSNPKLEHVELSSSVAISLRFFPGVFR